VFRLLGRRGCTRSSGPLDNGWNAVCSDQDTAVRVVTRFLDVNNSNAREVAMATLSVLKFDAPDAAENALNRLRRLQQQQLIRIVDAAVVTWPSNRKAPKTMQAAESDTVGMGMLGGAFWGLLFGVLFFLPIIGVALGAAAGALAGSLVDVGIDDTFIHQTREKVTPGTSALFLLSADAVADRVIPELKDLNPELLATNLSRDQETKLREVFAEAQ
jgi:uncharacterized membrane protein